MVISELPPNVKEFLQKRISSVHQLEVLLLLHRYPERHWFAREVGQELYTHPVSAKDEMTRLKNMGFLTSVAEGVDEEYWYLPQSEYLAEIASGLAESYRSHRLKVIDAIFSHSQENLRQFSDAFRLRKEDREE
jgi:hypothetical protein